ncbi:MAG TPA: ABC transporter permease [Cyclobacteriaceae bacterium]|nr:ABC transporter permease [Cyclobacteriaceae bacterium]
MRVLHQIFESFAFAWKALRGNLLRTILSLLGVTVGIFAIIAVFTLVDSLEKSIRDSLNFLGSDVIYVQKWPFIPESDGEFRWWDYWRRPTPSIAEYKFLEANMHSATDIVIFAGTGNRTIKRGNNSVGQVGLTGAGPGYDRVNDLNIEKGRFFLPDEIEAGKNLVVLGYEVASNLFKANEDPIGQEVKVRNLKYRVVGVLKKEGQNFMGTPSKDFSCIIPYNSFRKLYQTGTGRWNEIGSTFAIKGQTTDIGLVEAENELRGLLRGKRGLKPRDKDNFALNKPEAISNIISSVFNIFGIAGWIIGGFSILVGGFGIANIMFVSVKERTSIIGLQKSLGAKNYFILFQFLFESIFLSLIGGLAGISLVYLITFIPLGSLEVILTLKNIMIGIGVSVAIGVVSGIVPAAMAARLDPVDALRAS